MAAPAMLLVPLTFAWAGLVAQAGEDPLPSTDLPARPPMESAPAPPTSAPLAPAEPSPTPVGPCYDPPATTDREEEWANRTMKGHTFLYPTLFDTAFVASYVGIRAGVNRRSVPDVVVGARRFDLNLVGVAEGLDLGLKLTDWFGLQVVGGGRAIIGSNVPALVYDGATYTYEGRLSAVFRLMRLRSTGTQLSASVSGAFAKGQVVSLAPLLSAPDANAAVQTLVDGNFGDALRTPIRSVDGRVSLLFAQALGKLLSLQAAAAIGRHSVVVEPFDTATGTRLSFDTKGFQYLGAVALGIDGSALHVPIGGLVEYSLTRQPGTATLSPSATLDTVHRAAAGVYFTGARHLQTGISVSWEGGLSRIRTTDGESGRPDSQSAQFILRYVW